MGGAVREIDENELYRRVSTSEVAREKARKEVDAGLRFISSFPDKSSLRLREDVKLMQDVLAKYDKYQLEKGLKKKGRG